MQRNLEERIAAGAAKVAVVGLGYVGLPLAVEFADAGYHVTGVDLDPRKVKAVVAGESYIPDVPSERVARLVGAGRLTATLDRAVLADVDAAIICVPTPLSKTKDPDLTFVLDAARAIAEGLHPGQLVVLESTTYPGTTEELHSAHAPGQRPGSRA